MIMRHIYLLPVIAVIAASASAQPARHFEFGSEKAEIYSRERGYGFEPGVSVSGHVELLGNGTPQVLPAGTALSG